MKSSEKTEMNDENQDSERPERPEGKPDKPEEKPNKPEGMPEKGPKGPGGMSTFEENGDSITVTLDDSVKIIKKGKDGKENATVEDISEGDLVTLEYDETESLCSIEIIPGF